MPDKKIDYFLGLGKRPMIKLAPGIETIILTGDNGEGMMMVLTEVQPGVTVPMHAHPHEQMGMVYSGSAEMTIGGETRTITKGDFCNIPANVEHKASTISDIPFVMLDIFCPAREDFLEKLDRGK